MKRILAVAYSCLLLISLAACSACGENSASAPVPAADSTENGGSIPITTETSHLSSAQTGPVGQESLPESADGTTSGEQVVRKSKVQVDGAAFTATMEDNAAADAFVEMMQKAPVVIDMRDYSGFEKVGSLGTSLPTSNSHTTTQAGDIVLYNGNQVVVFYGSNSWSYTRLGKIDNLSGWEEALGKGDVTVTFSLK